MNTTLDSSTENHFSEVPGDILQDPKHMILLWLPYNLTEVLTKIGEVKQTLISHVRESSVAVARRAAVGEWKAEVDPQTPGIRAGAMPQRHTSSLEDRHHPL